MCRTCSTAHPTPIPYKNPMTRPALLLLAALPVLAQQTGALTGHLIDAATNSPIPNTETTAHPPTAPPAMAGLLTHLTRSNRPTPNHVN